MKNFNLLFLLIANLYPIYGLVYLNWDLKTLFLLYFAETFVIFIFTVIKMTWAQDTKTPNIFPAIKVKARTKSIIFQITIIGALLAFIYNRVSLTVFDNFDLSLVPISAIGFFILNHSFSFIFNFLNKKEFLKVTYNQVFNKFLGRFVVIYLTLIIGGLFYILSENKELNFLIILVILKTMLDIFNFYKDRDLK